MKQILMRKMMLLLNRIALASRSSSIFKMRSQDVLHSAYMPHFRAQMNCVPGMDYSIWIYTYSNNCRNEAKPQILDKVENINKIRAEKSEKLIEKGEEALDYEFDYLLLCNKICGKSHYNMQMKIIVETEEEYRSLD